VKRKREVPELAGKKIWIGLRRGMLLVRLKKKKTSKGREKERAPQLGKDRKRQRRSTKGKKSTITL